MKKREKKEKKTPPPSLLLLFFSLSPAKKPEIKTTAMARSHCSARGRCVTSTRLLSDTGHPGGVGAIVAAKRRWSGGV